MKEVTIIVGTHKKSEMPRDKMYLPLHLGAAGKNNPDGSPLELGYTKDDTGENISEKNVNFGTQTGLYWLWKNVDSEYKGLVHYRRFFTIKKVRKDRMIDGALKYDELKPLLGKYKVFVPRKRHYYIETLYSHYSHTFDKKHLDICRDYIGLNTPDYLTAFNKVMNRRWGYMFNMMILRTDLMDDYCNWLFPILFNAARKIDSTGMSSFDARFCGRISEILFNVWLEKKQEEGIISAREIKELHYVEDVDWFFKIKTFIYAKLFHKPYKKSS